MPRWIQAPQLNRMNVAFRVDASSLIGTGHFMRCLTLADAIKEHGGSSRFLSRNLPEHLRVLLDSRGHILLPLGPGDGGIDGELAHSAWLGSTQQADAQVCLDALGESPCDWLVVDHYALDECWETPLRQRARNILVIDDIADRNHDCDILLDQNLYAEGPVRYEGKTVLGCQLLLGPRYALLRPEFARQRGVTSPRAGAVRRLLVFFGGIDARNFTGKTLEALSSIVRGQLEVDVVIGALYPFRGEIEASCSSLGFSCHVETTAMAELMASADLSIGAGGAAVWERMSLGLTTFAIPTATNQIHQLHDLAALGLIYAPQAAASEVDSIRTHLLALLDNPTLVQAMSRAGWQVVDGRGAERVVGCLEGRGITIREARSGDSQDLFSWRNDPRVRMSSTNQQPISWADHEAWFVQTLGSSDSILLVGCLDEAPIGVVRFDVRNGAAQVSIYRVPGVGGGNLGRGLLIRAEVWLLGCRSDVTSFEAKVQHGNRASSSMFLEAGYEVFQTCFRKEASVAP